MSISTKISVISLILGLTLAYSLYYQQKYKKFFDSGNGLILKTLPEFSLESVLQEGKVGTDDFFAGKARLGMVHFWATWCAPCEVELPSFIELAKKFEKKGVIFLLVAVNDQKEKIKKFFKRFKSLPKNVRLVHDEKGQISVRFGTVKLPETYLFSSDGRHINKYVGAQDWGQKSVETRLKFYLESVDKLDS